MARRPPKEPRPPGDYDDKPLVPAAQYSPRDLQSVLDAPLAPAAAGKADQARMRRAITLLVRGNLPRVQAWLDAVADDDPKGAIELFLKLSKFAIPELRSIEVDMNVSGSADPRKMSIAELEEMVQAKYVQEKIVDEQ